MATIFLPQQHLFIPPVHLRPRPSSPYGIATLTDRPILPPSSWAVSSSQVSKQKNGLKPVCCYHGAGWEDDESRGVAFTQRREALISILVSSMAFPFAVRSAVAADAEENFRKYEDKENKYRIMVPQEWLQGTGETKSIKSITAFYPEEASSSNVSIVITPVGPDFTRLESFGKVDEFAESLVNGLDRSWQRPPGLAAKLIDSKAANGLYYIEYTLQNPGDSKRHILSVLGMASNGWYNRLYTVTGQFIEDESEKYRQQIEKSVSSFRLVKDADSSVTKI